MTLETSQLTNTPPESDVKAVKIATQGTGPIKQRVIAHSDFLQCSDCLGRIPRQSPHWRYTWHFGTTRRHCLECEQITRELHEIERDEMQVEPDELCAIQHLELTLHIYAVNEVAGTAELLRMFEENKRRRG